MRMDPRFSQLLAGKQTLDMNPQSEEDRAIAEFIQATRPRIAVVGTGGSGSNTLARMKEIGIYDVTFIAMNTDAQHLLRIPVEKKILLGKKKTRGMGAGSNPDVGQAAAEESESEIREILKDTDLVFITCGMGGGTGTGSA